MRRGLIRIKYCRIDSVFDLSQRLNLGPDDMAVITYAVAALQVCWRSSIHLRSQLWHIPLNAGSCTVPQLEPQVAQAPIVLREEAKDNSVMRWIREEFTELEQVDAPHCSSLTENVSDPQ